MARRRPAPQETPAKKRPETREEKIARLKGNQLHKLRAKHGRDKIFGDAQLLLDHAAAYWEWCDTHPRYRPEVIKHEGVGHIMEVPVGRPYSMDGLTIYLGVSPQYFQGAKQNLRNKIDENRASKEELDLLEAIHYIEMVTRQEQVEGAMTGQYKEAMVARWNAIPDNVNNTNTGENVVKVEVRDEKTRDNLDKLSQMLK